MRFVTNPASSAIRKWAVDYHQRMLASYPLADGFFVDNAHGKVPFAGISVIEPTTTYSDDSGAMVAAVNRAIYPKWVMSNTAGGRAEGTAVAAGSAAVIEEFLLRPLDTNWSKVNDMADLVAMRLNADGSPYVVLDSLPTGGSTTNRARNWPRSPNITWSRIRTARCSCSTAGTARLRRGSTTGRKRRR